MRRISVLISAMVLSYASISTAQLAVQEVGQNLTYNLIQSVEAVFQTAQWVLDLAPLENYIFPEGAAEDLARIAALAEEAQALSFDLSSLQSQLNTLFDPDSAPTTSYEFRERVTAINRTLFQTYSYAMRTQSLVLTAVNTVEHILGFIEIVAELTGKLSTSQLLSQQIGKLQQLQAEANVQRSAFERARSLEGITPVVLDQGIQNIIDQMMEDHPRW
jgi:conjugal transfer/entry exclusion protein